MINKCYMKDVLVARRGESVLEVSKILRDTQKRNLVVIDNEDRPIGFLSVVDINNRVIAEEKDPLAVEVNEVMTKSTVSLDEKETFDVAIEKMMDRNILSCPVTRNDKLIGMVEFKEIVSCYQKESMGVLNGFKRVY